MLEIINASGREALRIIGGALPILILTLVLVFGLERIGAVQILADWLGPVLEGIRVDSSLIVPAVTKYLAGGKAMVGVITEMASEGQIGPAAINVGSGFLMNMIGLPGLAIYAAASPRLARVMPSAIGGAVMGVTFRAVATTFL